MKQTVKSIISSLALLLLCTVSMTTPVLAQPETVELDISLREVPIGADFHGANIVIFGAVDDSQQEDAASQYYDIIVVIRGPSETVITRRKEERFGIWINSKSRQFDKVPSFYGVLSTRPLEEIADHATLRRLYIELDPTPFEKEAAEPDEFEEALIRLKTKEGLYVKNAKGVKFLSKSLFRASLELPDSVTEGIYSVRIYLFHDQQLLSWDKSTVQVKKAGLERYLFTLAYDKPYAYGLLAIATAILSGMIGWTVFRRN